MAGTREQLEPISILVAGAAGNFPAPASKISTNGFKSVLKTDPLDAFNAARAAFEQLRETRGCIIFISAGQALIRYAWQAHVGAIKAGIDNFMRNLAMEWGSMAFAPTVSAPGRLSGPKA